VWQNRVFALPDLKTGWLEVGQLPRPLAYGISVTTPDGLVCLGGSDASRHYAEVFHLSWSNGRLQIKPFPSLPIPLANAAGALLGNTIYIAGGSEQPGERTALDKLFAFDLSQPQPTWKEREPCPGKPRILPLAAVQEGSFFLVGGIALEPTNGTIGRVYLRDAWRYQPAIGWRRIADLPHPIAASPSPAPALGQSHFLVLGGDDGSKLGFQPIDQHPGFARDILAYHTITDTWTPSGEVPAARATVPVASWGGHFVVSSGEVRPGVRSPEVWAFTPGTERVAFGWLNYATLGAYLAAMVWLGVAFTKKNKTTDDFFRGGQRIPWWAAGLSIFATMLSSITFMAIPAQSYSVGWNLYLGNTYLLLTPLVVCFYLPFYRSLNVTSAYEYLEKRFNLPTRLLASALFILFQLGRVAIVLYLPALALTTVSNFDVTTCILLMGGLCILYTVLGGIEAVIWTDVAQAVILLGGAGWALATVIGRVDGGLGAIVSTAAAQGRFFGSVSWRWDYAVGTGWIIMLGSVFANLFTYTASQDIVQRYVTTADAKSAARAIWTNMALAPFAQGLFFAIGTALFVFYRQHPERLDPTLQTDGIFPLFMVHELPAGVAGVIVAGIFAAAQSTLASSLNSVATAYVTDFHRRFRPGVSDAVCLRLARWLTALVGLVGTGVALLLAQYDIRSLWETFLSVIGLFGGTIAGLFALGIFSRRATGAGALAGAVVSAVLVLAVKQFTPAHFFAYPIVGVLSCLAVGWLASLALPAPWKDLTGLTVCPIKAGPFQPSTLKTKP